MAWLFRSLVLAMGDMAACLSCDFPSIHWRRDWGLPDGTAIYLSLSRTFNHHGSLFYLDRVILSREHCQGHALGFMW